MTQEQEVLSFEIFTEGGDSLSFTQIESAEAGLILNEFKSTRVFAHPALMLGSRFSLTNVQTHFIDLIRVRSANVAGLFPRGNLLDIVELSREVLAQELGQMSPEALDALKLAPEGGELWTYVQLQTVGGHQVCLKLKLVKESPQEQRMLVAHIFQLPVIPFRIECEGFGLVNPSRVVWISTFPGPENVPDRAFPVSSTPFEASPGAVS